MLPSSFCSTKKFQFAKDFLFRHEPSISPRALHFAEDFPFRHESSISPRALSFCLPPISSGDPGHEAVSYSLNRGLVIARDLERVECVQKKGGGGCHREGGERLGQDMNCRTSMEREKVSQGRWSGPFTPLRCLKRGVHRCGGDAPATKIDSCTENRKSHETRGVFGGQLPEPCPMA